MMAMLGINMKPSPNITHTITTIKTNAFIFSPHNPRTFVCQVSQGYRLTTPFCSAEEGSHGVGSGGGLWAGKLRGNFRAEFYSSTTEGESQCGGYVNVEVMLGSKTWICHFFREKCSG